MKFSFTSLGTSSALPAYNRNLSAHIINANEQLYLIDCGEGTQLQLRKHRVKFQKIDTIFISHLHGDHFFGLIGFLTSMQLLGREKPINIFAPHKLKDVIKLQLKVSDGYIKYPIHYHDLNFEKPELILHDNKVKVSTIILKHRVPCCGFIFTENEKPKNVVKEKLETHDIPFAYINKIKQGNDFITKDGSKIPNSELTIAPVPPKSFAYCSDTNYQEKIVEQIKNVDLLYHEATFLESHAQRATETFHCTAKQAATIALKANVKKLLLGHFSARYKDTSLFEEEAREIFENTDATIEGKEYLI